MRVLTEDLSPWDHSSISHEFPRQPLWCVKGEPSAAQLSLAADRRPWLILEYTEVWPGVCLSIALVSSECFALRAVGARL